MRLLYLGSVMLITGLIASGSEPTVRDLAPSDPELNDLAWMMGSWVADQGIEMVDEHWTHPIGGTMLGVSRTVTNGRTTFFEYLRIEKNAEGVTYLASPQGRGKHTPYRMTKSTANLVVFENPQHDYPQKITYRREADGILRARIEGTQGGKPRVKEWDYQPARLVKN